MVWERGRPGRRSCVFNSAAPQLAWVLERRPVCGLQKPCASLKRVSARVSRTSFSGRDPVLPDLSPGSLFPLRSQLRDSVNLHFQ